jgi:hypothetical protein
MPRRSRNALDATFGWGRLMARTNQMWQEAALVMGARLAHPPSPAALMGTEKVSVGVEAMNAMARQWMLMGMGRAPSAGDLLAFWDSAMTPYHRRVARNARSIRRAARPRAR